MSDVCSDHSFVEGCNYVLRDSLLSPSDTDCPNTISGQKESPQTSTPLIPLNRSVIHGCTRWDTILVPEDPSSLARTICYVVYATVRVTCVEHLEVTFCWEPIQR